MADPKSQEEIQNEIINAIIERDDTIATDIGQPLRTIVIDPVAEVIQRGYARDYQTRLTQDIDNLFGEELDKFLDNFGFKRKEATRARGYLNFSRSTSAESLYVIPVGTRAFTADGLYFRTTVQAILLPGEVSVTVPAEAEIPGEKSNVAKNTIIYFTPVAGFTSVTNPEPFSGGRNRESDDEVKIRFKHEVLRNIAGTRDQYHSIPYEFDSVSAVSVVSPMEFMQEYCEFERIVINQNTVVTGAILNFGEEYVYPGTVFVEDADKTKFYTEGTDWSLEEGISATENKYWIKALPDSPLFQDIEDGKRFAWISYQYRPKCSRGPGCVDVFVIGSEENTAIDVFVYENTKSKYYVTKRPLKSIIEVRKVDGEDPIATEYYRISKDVSNACKSTSANDALEFISRPSELNNGDYFAVTYTYNSLIDKIQNEFRTRKQVTADVLAHEGIKLTLDIEAKIMLNMRYEINVSKEEVDSKIYDSLSSYIENLGFGAIIQFSDLEYVARRDVEELDNILITKITVTPEAPFDTITDVKGIFTNDFVCEENQYLSLGSIKTELKSLATWGD
jgi:hypothetical protein